MIMALEITGPAAAMNGRSRYFHVNLAPAAVASDPNTTSNTLALPKFAWTTNAMATVEHPELFDVSTTFVGTYDQSTSYLLSFTPKYYLNNYSDDQVFAMRDKMLGDIADAMSWIPADGTTLEKVKAAHSSFAFSRKTWSRPLRSTTQRCPSRPAAQAGFCQQPQILRMRTCSWQRGQPRIPTLPSYSATSPCWP